MAEKRKRSQNFAIEEKDKLVKLLALHKQTILNKKTDGSTNEAKVKSWIELTNTFNSSATVYRSKESLMKVWEKLKTESKLYYQSTRRNTNATGGGPTEVKIDPILEQVCALLGRACTGIMDVPDCDTEIPFVPAKKKCSEQSSAIDIFDEIISPTSCSMETVSLDTENEIKQTTQENSETFKISKTPLWSRRRPQLSHTNERTEATTALCNSFANVNKKKEDIEDLKRQLLEDEIVFKRKLYELQLQAAAKEIEIKDAVLSQIKGCDINVKSFFGMQNKK